MSQAYIDRTECNGCGTCVSRCPRKAISLDGEKAVIDRTKCTNCNLCASVCPHEAISNQAAFYFTPQNFNELFGPPDHLLSFLIPSKDTWSYSLRGAAYTNISGTQAHIVVDMFLTCPAFTLPAGMAPSVYPFFTATIQVPGGAWVPMAPGTQSVIYNPQATAYIGSPSIDATLYGYGSYKIKITGNYIVNYGMEGTVSSKRAEIIIPLDIR